MLTNFTRRHDAPHEDNPAMIQAFGPCRMACCWMTDDVVTLLRDWLASDDVTVSEHENLIERTRGIVG